jgi:hypothetical protein
MKHIFSLSLVGLLVACSLGFAANENIMVRYCVPDDPKVGEAAAFRLDVPAGLEGVFCIDVINQRDTPLPCVWQQ